MKKFLKLLPMIFVASCARDIQLPNDCRPAVEIICRPIYGRVGDWGVISDELARNIYRHNKMCETINGK